MHGRTEDEGDLITYFLAVHEMYLILCRHEGIQLLYLVMCTTDATHIRVPKTLQGINLNGSHHYLTKTNMIDVMELYVP